MVPLSKSGVWLKLHREFESPPLRQENTVSTGCRIFLANKLLAPWFNLGIDKVLLSCMLDPILLVLHNAS